MCPRRTDVTTDLQGAHSDVIRHAIETGDPLPGTRGFAGVLDGALVRDVLGRYPLYSERDDPRRWSADPADLDVPEAVPPGHRRHAVGGDEQLWTLPEPPIYADDEQAVSAVRSAVVDAVDDVAAEDNGLNRVDAEHVGAGTRSDREIDDDRDPCAIAFSGGIDSGILAARLDGPLYVGGFEGSHDVAAARDGAAALDCEVSVVAFSHADLERAVPEVVRATGRRNAMDVAIALPLYLVAERAAADGHARLAVGQGADELFGGYAKVANAPADHRVDATTVRDATREVVATLPAQLERDVLTLRAAGVEPVAPFLDDRVIAAALRLPDRLLVDGDERKVALRRAAAFLPEEIRAREKKAVQYGSLVSRELDRLARRAGFKRRMDDHVGRYIESLCS